MGEPRAESRGSGHQSEKRVSSPAQGKGVLFGWGSNRAPLLPTELQGGLGQQGREQSLGQQMRAGGRSTLARGSVASVGSGTRKQDSARGPELAVARG